MKYKFENEDSEYLEFGISNNELSVILGREYDDYYGGVFNIKVNDIEKLIKALHELRDEINGNQNDTFKMMKN